MLIEKKSLRAAPLVLLKIIMLQFTIVHSLSISSSNTKNNITSVAKQQQLYNQPQTSGSLQVNSGQQQPQITTIPPLLVTISQNSYIDTVVQQASTQSQTQPQIQPQSQPQSQPQPQPQPQPQTQTQQQQTTKQPVSTQDTPAHSAGELRSSNIDEHDESVPLATINNHSRNNHPMPRPPQYVDVSALVGRNVSSSSSNLNLPSSSGGHITSSSSSSSSSSGLSGKSRSGLPECATQQVCNAIFVRMNYTQKLCECSSNYNWKCSHNLDPQDGHTIELTRKFDKRIYTQIKTCEPLREVRACKSPTDWTLLALQSERSGKAHYVVVCKCPTWAQLEGPYTHNHPPYANIPGIRVYGMLCAHQTARSSAQSYATYNPTLSIYPEFPWSEALNVLNTTNLLSTLNSH